MPHKTNTSSRPEIFYKKGVIKNFAKFTGKHLCQSLFLNKIIKKTKKYLNETVWKIGTTKVVHMLRYFRNLCQLTKKNFGDLILHDSIDHALIFVHWLLIHLILPILRLINHTLVILIHHALITTSYIDFYNSLQYTFFIFT